MWLVSEYGFLSVNHSDTDWQKFYFFVKFGL